MNPTAGSSSGIFPLSRTRSSRASGTARNVPTPTRGGLVLYYTSKSSYSANNVTIFEQTAGRLGIPFQTIRPESRVEARFAPTPITSFALFYRHKFLTGEQMNAKRFKKLASKLVAGK